MTGEKFSWFGLLNEKKPDVSLKFIRNNGIVYYKYIKLNVYKLMKIVNFTFIDSF
jgi:hypothetical protein